MTTDFHPHAAGFAEQFAPARATKPSTNDEGPTVAAVAPHEIKQDDNRHFHGVPRAGQALPVIEGEAAAMQYLVRLRAQQADPDELALIVAMLYGAALRGFCRAIEKALGVRHA